MGRLIPKGRVGRLLLVALAFSLFAVFALAALILFVGPATDPEAGLNAGPASKDGESATYGTLGPGAAGGGDAGDGGVVMGGGDGPDPGQAGQAGQGGQDGAGEGDHGPEPGAGGEGLPRAVDYGALSAMTFEGYLADLSAFEGMPERLLESGSVGRQTQKGPEYAPFCDEVWVAASGGPFFRADNFYRVIGEIEIEKIGIRYRILNVETPASLEMSIVRFRGPQPNEVGNLSLAGHNRHNGTWFSDLHKLVLGDVILITDNGGRTLEYEVYDIFVVKPTNTDSVLQNDDGRREITLITCINNDIDRLIIKATEIVGG